MIELITPVIQHAPYVPVAVAVSEPLITWNLILCGIAFPILVWVIKDSAKKSRDITELRFQELSREIVALKDWLTEMQREIDTKTPVDDSNKRDNKFDRHDHIIDCDGVDCTAKTTSGIVLRHTI